MPTMIGIFDSGSGGLTVLSKLRERFPLADVIYFGDIANAPYGSRSRDELTKLTVDGIRLLRDRGANSIISACNSLSASLAISLFDTLDIEPLNLIEMVGPTVSFFKNSTARVLMVATQATIDSGIYQNAFRMINKEIVCCAVPNLAGVIEHGEVEVEGMIRDALMPHIPGSYDVLILACTHYPLVQTSFEKVVGSSVIVFDPAEVVAMRAEARFWPRESGDGTTQFLISKDSVVFRSFVAKLFPETGYAIEVV